MTRSVSHRMQDILAAIAAVQRADELRSRYAGDENVAEAAMAAIQFHVFTIGEAVKSLPEELTSQWPDVPWSSVVRMRDLIGHHYYKLDPEIIRATTAEPLSSLRIACEAMLAESRTD